MVERVCVVGAGRWGRNHVRTLSELECLGGVVEIDPARREAIAQLEPGVRLFDDLTAALKEDFDGFTVATPAETHAEVAARIIRTGKSVLVEKPLALSAADARHLAELADRHGVQLMVGHVMLFHPAIRRIRDLIAGGKIGRLQYLYSNRLNLGTVRTEENILWSFAPHDISIFQFLIGARPLEVVSRGGTFLRPGVHDSTMTILTYPENIVGHIFVSWLHPFKEHRLVVIGSKGMLSFEDALDDRNLRFYEKGIDWIAGEPIKRDGPTEVIHYDRRMPLAEELSYFIEHLRGPRIEIADARSAVQVLEILEEASRSLDRQESSSPPIPSSYFCHPSSCIDAGASIGPGTKIWHFSHVQTGARIGRNCTLGQNVYVGSNVTIGDDVKIQNNVSVYEGVELQDQVFCGPSVVFTNVLDPRSAYPQRGSEHYRRTVVQKGATLGANSTVVCGHTIGRHAFIAAGAVVACDVPDHALMMGVPARLKGWVCECGQRLPPFDRRVTCRRCELKYELQGRILSPLNAAIGTSREM